MLERRMRLVLWLFLGVGLLACNATPEVVARAAGTVGPTRLLLALLLGFALSLAGSLPMSGPLALLVLDRTLIGERVAAFWITLAGALVEGCIAAGIGSLLPLVLQHSSRIVLLARASGALVILVVGVALLLRPGALSGLETQRRGQSLLAGFLTTALNPTLLATWTFAVTTLHANGLLDGGLQSGLLFGAGVVLGVFGWFLVLLQLAPKASPERMARYRRAIGRSIGAILVFASALTFLRIALGGEG
jgi:threonine/homoserine/homoserine lactone efflux protein